MRKELGASNRVLPLNFEAFHPEALQAEGPLVPFPLPKAGKTLTAVLPPSQDDSGLWSDDDDGFEDDVRDLDELDVIDVEAGDAAGRKSDRALQAVPPSVAQQADDRTPEATMPPMLAFVVCSEACRAKLVVAVEEEKEAR